MNMLRLVAIGTAVLLVGGCAASDIVNPTAAVPAEQAQSPAVAPTAARPVATSGSFVALVDFSTITLTPRGNSCVLQVKGRLVFSGTIEGPAIGQTTALVFAPCADVATTAPGTYPDIFASDLAFDGTIGGVPARADVIYTGHSEPGGHISAHLIFSRGVAGVLDVDAQLAVGGTYRGSLVVR